MSDEHGQTFVEWLGVIVFVVVLVGIVMAMAPGIGHTIAGVVRKAVGALGL